MVRRLGATNLMGRKKQKKHQLMVSLYGKYSMKQYSLPAHIFQIIKRKYMRKSRIRNTPSYRFEYFVGIPIQFFYEDQINILFPDEVGSILISRPKRNASVPQDDFLVRFYDESIFEERQVIIKIPIAIQFLICLKARPIKI